LQSYSSKTTWRQRSPARRGRDREASEGTGSGEEAHAQRVQTGDGAPFVACNRCKRIDDIWNRREEGIESRGSTMEAMGPWLARVRAGTVSGLPTAQHRSRGPPIHAVFIHAAIVTVTVKLSLVVFKHGKWFSHFLTKCRIIATVNSIRLLVSGDSGVRRVRATWYSLQTVTYTEYTTCSLLRMSCGTMYM
jgi:hypothetical protein